MAKSSSKKKSKTAKVSQKNEMEEQKRQQKKRIITMEELDAISSDDDDNEGQVLPPEHQWNSMAKNLRKAIEDGAFDKLLDGTNNDNGDDGDEEFEEATLDSSGNSEGDEDEEGSDDDDGNNNKESNAEDSNDDSESGSEDDDEEEEESGDSSADDKNDQADQPKSKQSIQTKDDDSSEVERDDDDEEEDKEQVQQTKQPPKEKTIKEKNSMSSKALEMVTVELEAVTATIPWAETLEIIPQTPLPFGAGNVGTSENAAAPEDGDDEEDNSPLDIHDDLKREAAFYNTALDAVMEARKKCRDVGIPFSRPDDFFAEMVKTDDHMAKIKDRLIFENKKIEAVAQRKANREQKLRSKESHANKLAEKAKRKKDHLQQVEEWAKNAATNRGGAMDDDEDDAYLARMGGGRVNKKRKAADRKYGYGGKRGRFKQMDRKTLNDTSGFNPRGNFGGMGTKRTASGGKSFSGSGAKRHGKRARDASRSRRS